MPGRTERINARETRDRLSRVLFESDQARKWLVELQTRAGRAAAGILGTEKDRRQYDKDRTPERSDVSTEFLDTERVRAAAVLQALTTACAALEPIEKILAEIEAEAS